MLPVAASIGKYASVTDDAVVWRSRRTSAHEDRLGTCRAAIVLHAARNLAAQITFSDRRAAE